MNIWNSSEEAWRAGLDYEEKGDIKNAIVAYEFAAKQNHPLAQNNLGNLLDEKISPPQHKMAEFWYKKAVENGESAAAWNLGIHFEKSGNQVESDKWMKIAAKMGDTDAFGYKGKYKSK